MTHLRKNGDGETRDKKVINCEDELKKSNGVTDGWLENLEFLSTVKNEKSKMTHKRLFEAILNKQKDVVLKIGDETENQISHEFDVYKRLMSQNLGGFLKYICYFECNDKLATIEKRRNGICNPDTPSKIRVLMMEYVKNKNLAEYQWSASKLDSLKSCIKQVCCSLEGAYKATGFRHNDFHAKNVVLKPTTLKTLEIDGNVIEVFGLKALIMDLELSQFDAPLKRHYEDYKELFKSLDKYIQCEDFLHIAGFLSNHINRNTEFDFNELLKMIDYIKCVQITPL